MAEAPDRSAQATAHFIGVHRTARYYTLGNPGPAVTDVWLVLHGYAQLAHRFLGQFTALARPNRLIVAPEGLSRFYLDAAVAGRHAPGRVGASWMTAQDAEMEVRDYVGYLDQVYTEVVKECTSAVFLRVLGFSQGVATACRWAVLGAAPRVDQLILWAGLMPKTLAPAAIRARLAGVRMSLVAGDDDEYVPAGALEAQARELEHLGIVPEISRFRGRHALDGAVLERIAT